MFVTDVVGKGNFGQFSNSVAGPRLESGHTHRGDSNVAKIGGQRGEGLSH